MENTFAHIILHESVGASCASWVEDGVTILTVELTSEFQEIGGVLVRKDTIPARNAPQELVGDWRM